MGSRMVQEMIFGLFPLSSNMISKWGRGGGVLASGEANANFFPVVVLTEIWLVPDLWARYGLFRYATNDHPQTTPEKL